MARKIPLVEIRKYTSRSNVNTWLPSISGNLLNFAKTFTLNGENYSGATSLGEINSNTIFGKGKDELGKTYDNTKVLEENLLKFYLTLYCLLQDPLKNQNFAGPSIEGTATIKNNRLFTKELQKLFFNLQTYNTNLITPNTEIAKKISRSITCDAVRYYKKDLVGDVDPIEDQVKFTNLIKFAQKLNGNYQKNVAGVLGKVTYDSIIKHTLYSLLKQNNFIKDLESTDAWTVKASRVQPTKTDIFVDVAGGPYLRAFPVACVVFNDTSGKTLNELLPTANNLVGQTFGRKLDGTNQLVTTIIDKEKNFLEVQNRATGSSLYCIVYDLIKVLVLDPIPEENIFLDLIKIGLSLLSRKGFTQKYKFTKDSLFKQISEIKNYLNVNFTNLDNNKYNILYQNKHNLETSYILKDAIESIKPKTAKEFSVQIQNLGNSLENVYQQILQSVNTDAFYLHFDTFYNLLAVTTDKQITASTQSPPADGPFVLEEYSAKGLESDLIKTFFQNSNTLPKYGDKGLYEFNPSIAQTQKIISITDSFISEFYGILDDQESLLLYDTDENSTVDDVKEILNINLLKLINDRTGGKYKLIKSDYISKNVQGKVNTVSLPPSITKLDINTLNYSFDSVGIPKIKLQTLSHFLFTDLKQNPTEDDFIKLIYYPRLKLSTSTSLPTDETGRREFEPPEGRRERRGLEEPVPVTTFIPIPKLDDVLNPKEKNRDFLINNIITSELACYEDIAESIDVLVNSDFAPEEKISKVFKVIYNIGFPFLLATVSQIISSKLSELLKDGETIDSDLLACVNKDLDKVKKTIINYADLLANLDNAEQLAGLFLQEIPDIPQIPNIPYLLTFDSEEELKRKVIQYVIDGVMQFLSGAIKKVLKNFIDICNADSYLFAFLQSAFDLGEDTGKKLSSPTPSGMVAGNISPVYIPVSITDINDLIDKSGIETKEFVYEAFRKTFFVNKTEYGDQEISIFFSKISEVVDAGEMASLLKGTSSVETRNVVLGFIKNYLVSSSGVGKFYLVISDDQGIQLLFSFLSQYINYRLCYEQLSKSIANFTPTVCFNPNSKFDEYSKIFNEDAIEQEKNNLLRSLDDLCSTKLPDVFDLLDNGPTVVTKNFIKTIVNAVSVATSYKPPTASVGAKTDKYTGVEETITPLKIYESAFLLEEVQNTLNLIKKLKEKSSYILNKVFRIGMSFTDYNFLITYPGGQVAAVTYDDYPEPIIKDNKIIAVQSPTARFFQRIGYENNITTTKYVDFENQYEFTKNFVTQFLDSVKWKNIEKPAYQNNPTLSLYGEKISDNFVFDEYFAKQSKIPENATKLWQITDKEGKTQVLLWPYYLYLLSNFHQPFIDEVNKSVGSEEQDNTIKQLFKVVKETPSLEQYYIFSAKIYEMAYKLEQELLVDSTIIDEDLEPWLYLKINKFPSYAINRGNYNDEVKTYVKNLGNYAIKTDMGAIDGYLKEYEIFRKTDTRIYDSISPGAPVSDPNLIINFIEEE